MSPIVTVDNFTRPEHATDYWVDLLTAQKDRLGFNYVAGYDQKLIPSYPAIAISPGRCTKEVHATHTWLYTWRVQFYVMHGQASGDHLKRSRDEAALVTSLVEFIESDLTLGDKIIFGYVETEVPGVTRPFNTPNILVLSTRIDWTAISEGRF